MREGALAGMPLQLVGKILEYIDWGDYGAPGTFIKIGSVGIEPNRKLCLIFDTACNLMHHLYGLHL